MTLQADGYTFELAADIMRTPVKYRNRYGIELAADVYRHQDLDTATRHSAVVIGPPHGGVKEQGPGIYAQELARRGFVALAFDPSYNGDSGGAPRHLTSPEIFAEDFSAAVDYLGTLDYVDRERIGAVGLCGSGGFLINAARGDVRIRACVTAALYDISRVSRRGWGDTMTEADRAQLLADIAEQRWHDVDVNRPTLTAAFPDEVPDAEIDPITEEFFEYYVGDRGRHPHATGAFTVTSAPSHISYGSLPYLDDLMPRPILLITGERAYSRYFSDEVFKDYGGPKDLIVVPGARHIDLYDRVDLIPFDAIEDFFRSAL